MDRPFYYSGEVPRTVDVLQGEQNTMVSIAKLCEAALGTTGFVTGLGCTQNGPPALNVLLAGGQVFQLTSLEATTYSSLAADTSDQIVKQGIQLATQTIPITPPGTPGFSQVFLIEVQYTDLDGGSTVLPYYNSSNPAAPFSGPGNTGTAQNTKRQGVVSVQVKAGTAATTGTQVAPSVDSGWIGLWNITVANGASSVVNANIVQVANAPIIGASYMPKLPAIPAYIQSGAWGYVADTGAANAITVAPSPPLTALAAGNKITVKILNTVTGATTLAYTLSGGSVNTSPVVHGDGTALVASDLVAGQVVELNFDGSNWQMPRASTSVTAQQITASAVGLNAPINCAISASASAGALTVTVLGANNAALSSSNPLIATFRSATIGSGLPVTNIVTSNPTFTVNSGSTLGTTSGVCQRFWVVLINNAGTTLVGLQNCSNGTTIFPLNESVLQTTGTGTGGGNSAGIIYTSVGTVGPAAIRIIGYLEWTTALVTAGSYVTTGLSIVLCGPTTKKPLDLVQGSFSATGSVSITPTSAANMIRFSASGAQALTNTTSTVSWKRAAATIVSQTVASGAAGVNENFGVAATVYDQPNTVSATAYTIVGSAGTFTATGSLVEEIMA